MGSSDSLKHLGIIKGLRIQFGSSRPPGSKVGSSGRVLGEQEGSWAEAYRWAWEASLQSGLKKCFVWTLITWKRVEIRVT